MTDALLVKRSARLSISGVELRLNVVIRKLVQLSGLNVERGGFLGKKIYAYFDDVDSANAAANAIVGITYCRTKVYVGDFDVTNLVLSDNTQRLRNLRLQAQAAKLRSVKRSSLPRLCHVLKMQKLIKLGLWIVPKV
jgi:GT2 family glycosyltransferase